MPMLWLPDAVRDPHGRALAWAEHSDPKGCLHTTETPSWPSYQAWTVNPHATVLPTPGKGVTVRQHIPFNQAAFALRNLPGGGETNRDYVFQFELVGTCDPRGPGYRWYDADPAVLRDLYRKVIQPLSEAYGIPVRSPRWLAYPDSYGPSPVRMSGAAFDGYTGWLGHQHVPENVHGDPGAFPWARMLEAVAGAVKPPSTEDDDMSLKFQIARVAGDTDDRIFLIGYDRRKKEVTAKAADELIRKGLAEDAGEVLGSTLDAFPTTQD